MIYIVIVTYNGIQWIEQCLNSIPKDCNTVIIDNNSLDNTVSFIKEKFPKVHLIEKNENLGFGKANNIGISYALNQGAAYVFLLNQDAYLETNTIESLIKIHKENKNYGILSPIHLNGSNDGLDINFSNYALRNREFLFDAVNQKYSKYIYEVPFVNAAAWLIPRNTIELVGGFDPIFFHYGEDDNYCQRVLYHQLKVGIVPNTFVLHDREFRTKSTQPTYREQLLLKERVLKYNWANINVNVNNQTSSQQNKYLKLIVKLLLKFQFNKAKFYYNEFKLIKSIIPEIINSREINKTKGKHYLNF
ncbi:glycosyltransferase family 2 protein [Lutibacter holmesii]|uniref:Glycosyltransferase family 2 protein n=1 Tax=Lutibacter holmesii TaxID=1137985 RepID=A0ABW3WR59_9FLAO